MGLYDYVICEYPLPDPEVQGVVFQTKSLNPGMSTYTISKGGKLIHRKERWEPVPEEERPYFGKPEWDDPNRPFCRVIGSVKTIYEGDEEVPYHGIIDFYHFDELNRWYEYRAKFTDGQLVSITKVEDV